MKKTTNRTASRHKLVLPREVIAELVRQQLARGAGGSPCSEFGVNSCTTSNPPTFIGCQAGNQ